MKKTNSDDTNIKADDIEFLKKTFDELNIAHYMSEDPEFL